MLNIFIKNKKKIQVANNINIGEVLNWQVESQHQYLSLHS